MPKGNLKDSPEEFFTIYGQGFSTLKDARDCPCKVKREYLGEKSAYFMNGVCALVVYKDFQLPFPYMGMVSQKLFEIEEI